MTATVTALLNYLNLCCSRVSDKQHNIMCKIAKKYCKLIFSYIMCSKIAFLQFMHLFSYISQSSNKAFVQLLMFCSFLF